MTADKPTTLSIDQSEWRVLFADNVQRLAGFVSQAQTLTPEDLPKVLDHLDRAKVLAVAWQRAAVPVATATVAEGAGDGVAHVGNGAEAPKRKGGWQKGRPRKRMNPAQVVQ